MFIKDDYMGGVFDGERARIDASKMFYAPIDEKELIGATVVGIDTQRCGLYQPQIILEKNGKQYSVCTSTNGKVQITEVKKDA